MSSPVTTIPRLRFGRESFGGPSITINVPNPGTVRADEVAGSYNEARSQVIDARRPKGGRKRSTLSPKREKLASFVTETPRMTWPQRFEIWNERNPEYSYKTQDAMRQAFRRL